MKTNYTFQQKTLRFLSLFVGAITVTACGSYQNSSYYDNDGVYGPDKTVTYERQVQDENIVVIEDNNKYTQQFKDMEGDFPPTEVLTDVDNYNSNPDTVYVQESNSRYAGWGENQTSNVTINVYDNWGWNQPYFGGFYGNNWGWNNWGWNGWYGNSWGWNGWYGNSWGWNSGWGWNNGWYGNNWGWNNGWYGNGWYGNGWGWNGWYGNGYYGGRNVAYHNSPRGGYVNRSGNSGRYSTGRSGNTIGTPRNQTSQPRGNAIGTPRNQTSEPRTISTPRGNTNVGTPRNQTSQPKVIITQPRSNTNTGTPRNQGSGPKIYTPRNDSPRSDSPRSISTPRSSDFGGGRSSGGSGGSSGGGRSSGGGGGRGGRG